MAYPGLRNHELARDATYSDPALNTVVGGNYNLGAIRVLPGRVHRLQVQNATVTGTSPSLSFQAQESDDLAAWTNTGTAAVLNAAGLVVKQTLQPSKPWLRVVISAKSGTTPGATGVHVNVLAGSP
jgi:hypothetical protein